MMPSALSFPRPTPRALRFCASLCCCLAFAPTARSQPPTSPPLTRIEQTIADVDPLRTSSRHLAVDLRAPTGFGEVYRLDASPAPAGWRSDGLFARVSGAVYAVFPHSVYSTTRRGLLPEVPPGTIFYLGGLPPPRFPADSPTMPAANYVDRRADTRAPGPPHDPDPSQHRDAQASAPGPRLFAAPVPPPRRGIMTDETFRRDTIRALLLSAAKNASG